VTVFHQHQRCPVFQFNVLLPGIFFKALQTGRTQARDSIQMLHHIQQGAFNHTRFDNMTQVGFAQLGAVKMHLAVTTGVPYLHITIRLCQGFDSRPGTKRFKQAL